MSTTLRSWSGHFQERVPVTPEDYTRDRAQKSAPAEHQHFPKIIEAVVAASAPANTHPANASRTPATICQIIVKKLNGAFFISCLIVVHFKINSHCLFLP